MPAYPKLMATLLACACVLALAHAARASEDAGFTSTASEPALFRRVLPDIKSRTRIPILLPGRLPGTARASEVRHVDGHADAAKYEINLYGGEGLSNATFVGYFAGERTQRDEHFGEPVTLADGKVGYFHARSCGGSCAPSQIEWQRQGVLYSVQLRLDVKAPAEEKRDMVEAANSAILGGPR